ncbi:MAG: hypothetical protein UIQ67_07430 [Bacteroidales bacterium]|nr:hypothetical protein [Bacteroidales bacterium]
MIKIGYCKKYVRTSLAFSEWIIRGKIVFNGPTYFFGGTYILVADDALLSFGGIWNMVGTDSKIICFDEIRIGKRVDITWECRIMDTSFHYIVERNKNATPLTKKVIIGDYVWIGNRTSITTGTIIPNHSIVASNSLVNRDLSLNGYYCLFAGIPAKVVRKNVQRVWNEKRESEIDVKFVYHRVRL